MLAGIIAMVRLTYDTSTQIKVIQAQTEERVKVQVETYEMAKANNIILANKADEATNTAQHVVLQNELLMLGKKVDRLYYNQFSSAPTAKADTAIYYYALDSSYLKPFNQWVMTQNYE
jgi:hypothetical protein